MVAKKKKYLLTGALLYANGPVHIAHLAGVYLPMDIYARYLRKKGAQVLVVTGSDEYGVAITLQARKQAITPQALVDKYHEMNKNSLRKIGISYDIFSRTTKAVHRQTAQAFFTELHKKGLLKTATTQQFYDEEAKIFLADRYLRGTCPKCDFSKAYGDQCEACGSTLSPEELINPISVVSDAVPVKKKSSHWYFPLQAYQAWLENWILKEKKNWKPNVYGQCKAWLAAGLEPRAITRDLAWGVPVPLEGEAGKVLYVWFEAPIGYISATKDWAAQVGADWRSFWEEPTTELIHFMGKDNIVFHTIIFPSMLQAHGKYILPKEVVANEFLQLDGEKFSTSRNHAIWLHEYLEKNPGKEDVLRYVLCRNAPESKDANFTWADFVARNNNELVATLGNFIHRTQILLAKNFASKLPPLGPLDLIDKEYLAKLSALAKEVAAAIEQFKFKKAIALWMEIAQQGNKYLAATAPWKSFKKDPVRAGTSLHIAYQMVATLAITGEPFLPFTSIRLQKSLGLTTTPWSSTTDWTRLLVVGASIEKVAMLFSKIDSVEELT